MITSISFSKPTPLEKSLKLLMIPPTLTGDYVQVVMHVLSQRDHGLDLVLPRQCLAAHNAIYDVERFRALINTGRTRVTETWTNRAFVRE